jgi:hypothetical protein
MRWFFQENEQKSYTKVKKGHDLDSASPSIIIESLKSYPTSKLMSRLRALVAPPIEVATDIMLFA